jgi:hypothetical protein
MRNGDVGADEAVARHGGDESGEIVRRDLGALVGAREPVLAQPETMDHRRTRVADGPANDAGARSGWGFCHAATYPRERRKSRSATSGSPRIVE